MVKSTVVIEAARETAEEAIVGKKVDRKHIRSH